ncbi:DUF5668 domain-containing protein [Nemorincola caseinilytica]|uniref:DUF5668 domain-containing protein n=1 Tax=Nemorincola caseinilytica TaxID=2054315 RepID=A0ABP8NIZ1_9BACT
MNDHNNWQNKWQYKGYEYHQKDHRGGRIVFGIILALIGVGLLLKTLGLLHICLHSLWPLILIAMGTMIGVKNRFRNNAWWILIALGTFHLIPRFEIMGVSSSKLVWPVMLIALGLMIVFRPRHKHRFDETVGGAHVSSEDSLRIDVTFGGRKEIITSKDFKGGSATVTFGGSEINLTQSDMTSPSVVLDCRVAFGAIELVIPANWDLQNEIRPSFGSVEDERVIHAPVAGETRKKLILTGSCTFGSIDIKSY